MNEETTFVTAHEAALKGLHADIRGDQCLVHGSAFVERRAAPEIATTADRGDFKRLGVVPVVVLNGLTATVSTREVARVGKFAFTNGGSHLVMGLLFGTAANREAFGCLAGVAAEAGSSACEQSNATAINASEAPEACSHGSSLDLGRVINQGAPCRVGPSLVLDSHPVLIRVEEFAGQRTLAFTLKNYALMWWERAFASRPRRDVSEVLVAKGSGHICVTFEISDHRVGSLLVRGRVFVHGVKSNYI